MTTPYYGQPVNIGEYQNFTATTIGTLIKTGEGVLFSLIFNKPVAAGVITLYDGLTTGGTLIGTITVPASPQLSVLPLNIRFATGLFIVIATNAQDLTVSYR